MPVKNTKTLTCQQVVVLFGLASGLTYKEIGRALDISLNTVREHARRSYKSLRVNNRIQAVNRYHQILGTRNGFHMNMLTNLTAKQHRQAADLKEQIATLKNQLGI